MFECKDPNCPALKRPVLPMGRSMALHIVYYHGGDEIVPVVDHDPTGEIGLKIIDRMLKFCEDFDKVLGKKPPYKPKFREPYYRMRAECIADVAKISKEAVDEIGADHLG